MHHKFGNEEEDSAALETVRRMDADAANLRHPLQCANEPALSSKEVTIKNQEIKRNFRTRNRDHP